MITNMFKILNLMYNRYRVTRKEIMAACDISERTAYRYINRLSEANIPVYYDTESGGYRLNKPSNMLVNYLGPLDSIIIQLGLRLLRMRLGGRYSSYFEMIDTVIVRVGGTSQSDTYALENKLALVDSEEKIADSFGCYIILEAAILSKRIRLEIVNSESVSSSKTIEKPALRYSDKWYVYDQRSRIQEEIAISQIVDIHFL